MDQTGVEQTSQVAGPTFFLTLTLFFTIIFYLYGYGVPKRRNRKGELDEPDKSLPGLEVIPGPKSWDHTGILVCVFDLLPFEKSLENGLKMSEKYGEVFKLFGLNQTWVALNSAPTAKILLKSSDLGHVTKPPSMYGLMKPFITNGVNVSHGKFWQHERKILLKSQSYPSIKAYMPMLNKHCKMFISSLDEMFKDGMQHEINGLINSSFIKVVSEMITGFDNDQSDEHSQYHHNFNIWKESFINRLLKPWLLFPPLWKLHPLSRKHDKAIAEMFEFARRRIREHKLKRDEEANSNGATPENKSGFRSVLDELIDGGVEEGQIIDEINAMIFGGHETGASVIHCFLFCMALHPEIQKECQEEIDQLFQNPSSYLDGNVTFDAISSNLKLVERCILETLRLFPPGFIFFRKLQSPLKIHANSQDILLPTGTNVAVSPYSLHRKPDYYPEPERFDPDRFLPEECAKRHPYAFIPFSAGPRNCLGMKFAMIEMKIIVAYTLRHYFITTTDRMEDIPMLPFVTLTPAKDYSFKFTKRDSSCEDVINC